MSIQAIRTEQLVPQTEIGQAQNAGANPADTAAFSEVFTSALQDANTQQLNADMQIQDLVTGKQESVDEVALSVVKADLAFRMIVEIRNKLVSAFQEVMRMQV